MKILNFPSDRRGVERAFEAGASRNERIEKSVAAIIADVRKRGDKALAEYSLKFDGQRITAGTMRVDPKVCKAAWNGLSPKLAAALEFAREGIEAFHRKQVSKGFVLNRGGARLEQRIRALRTIGAYIPGGMAAYPSTMLMNVIPAQVAGVPEIIVATPPIKGPKEKFVPLAVAHLLGVSDSIYQVGGAQAVAALAFGTKTVPCVDKVVGPGNEYVATAKKLLYGVIDIDSVAGNSEVLIIADSTSRPDYIAADLLAQGEHTGRESVVLVGIGAKFDFDAVERELARQLKLAPRRKQAESSLKTGGLFIRAQTPAQAAEVANMKAPEHMEILAQNPEKIADMVDRVGAIFIGPYTPEPIGDYVAGPNHVLPTGGTARFFSPLGVAAFLKASNVLTYGEAAFRRAAPHVIEFAESEGLFAHAEAIRVRQGRH